MGHEANRESEGRPCQTIYSIKHRIKYIFRVYHGQHTTSLWFSIQLSLCLCMSSSCGFSISHCLLCVCVCLPYYRTFSRNRSFAVFCGFFLRRKFKAAENGRRFCLLQERLTISPSRNKLVFAKFRLTKSRIN